MSDVKWIKITTDIFDDEKILLIESLPDAYSIIVVWFKLLCLAGKMNNSGVFMMNNQIAYTDKMLATIFRMKESTVQLALVTFEQFGMVEIVDGVITIPNWGKHQNLDQLESKKEYMRGYMKEYREKQKALTIGKPNCKTNSKSNVSEAEEDREGDLDLRKRNDSSSTARASAAVDYFLHHINANASGECLRELIEFEQQLGSEVCVYALRTAQDNNVRSWSYCRAILQAYLADGVRTVDEIKQREANKQPYKGWNRRGGKTTPGTSKTLSEAEKKAVQRALKELEDET